MYKRLFSIPSFINALIITSLAVYFFLIPFGTLIVDLRDPALKTGDMPRFAYRWHKSLTQKYEPWAIDRVASKQAQQLNIDDISGTEWPIFSSVYYLWATEALQEAWEKDRTLSPESPADYAAGAIEAAADLVADPNHATWVQKHWGADYLTQENIFYRMLLIGGLTSYQSVSGDDEYQDLLVKQVETLSAELKASPHGLLDDYPGQCYPIDILPAIAVIKRSDQLLGTDHSDFLENSVRGFSGSRLDPQTLLPAYVADSKTGQGFGPARGVGMSYMLIWAPELWPNVSEDWYRKYEMHFWQKTLFVTGIREFASVAHQPNWMFEIDAGPIVGGYGTAASAFGIGAARSNGRIDHAYPLSVEALVFTWPLPNGTLLTTRPLSSLSDAPFIGETALLFTFTRQLHTGTLIVPDSFRWPLVTYLGLFFYLLFGCLGMRRGYRKFCEGRTISHSTFDSKIVQFRIATWVCLAVCACLLYFSGSKIFLALIILLIMQPLSNQKLS